ncbi:DotD/TraH family lipoprotein [Acinetobacter sp. Marseille-Q1618]|uniref:DotD/TraH family lipoprotein n=1 Tax=Acinetobacter sp. Marseille-Q1618 TaxID=2697502 RepID=UPI00156ED959|nr:DotD/TraH family lipoprotein [Acinetobacter sp. Marseille-Q1618]
MNKVRSSSLLLKNLSVVSLGLAITGLVGCQSYYYVPSPKFDVESPLAILSKSAQDAVAEQQTYALAQREYLDNLAINNSNIRKDVLTVDFIGDPQTLLQSVAYRFGYRFVEAGNIHQLPIVNFHKRKMTGFDLVRDTAHQLGKSADVEIDEQSKTITLIHK